MIRSQYMAQKYNIYIPLLVSVKKWCNGIKPIEAELTDYFLFINKNQPLSEEQIVMIKEMAKWMKDLEKCHDSIENWCFNQQLNIDQYDVNDKGEIVKVYDAEKEAMDYSNKSLLLQMSYDNWKKS